MLDILIKNGIIVDGTGKEKYLGDIGINDNKIVKIGNINLRASRIINAKNLVVTPGFIDIHSHSELSILVNSFGSSKIYQGITTEVVGNCGSSLAPVYGKITSDVESKLKKYGLNLTWRNMEEYFKRLTNQGLALNLISLVGHGLLRSTIIGNNKRKATNLEIKQMKILLKTALKEGAYGLSTGLIYPPSSYANKQELVRLCQIVANYNGIYATHLRDEGDYLIKSVKEAIAIAKETGVKVQVSHHKATGKNNWGKIDQSLDLINEARSQGLDITCDVYPYLATSTGLSSLLPNWIFGGSKEQVINKLKNDKNKIISYLNNQRAQKDGWDKIIISESNKYKDYEGLTIKEIAKQRQQSPAEVVINLLIAEKLSTIMIRFSIAESDFKKVLKSDFSMIGTDAMSRVKNTILAKSHCHPRTYGTFPRIINKYVKKGVISLEEAVKKMTFLPANKLDIKRGLINTGYYADVVILDFNKIKDKATYQNPHQYSTGIEYVIINGQVVVENKKQTFNLPGYVLKNL